MHVAAKRTRAQLAMAEAAISGGVRVVRDTRRLRSLSALLGCLQRLQQAGRMQHAVRCVAAVAAGALRPSRVRNCRWRGAYPPGQVGKGCWRLAARSAAALRAVRRALSSPTGARRPLFAPTCT